MGTALAYCRLRCLAMVFVALFAAQACRAQTVDRRLAYPFMVRADFSLAEYSPLFDELVQMQSEISRVLALPPARETVHVVLFRDEATYRTYGKKHFPAVPFRRALFVKSAGPGTVYAFRGPEFPVDVRHESTHGLLHATLPMVPLWLDEGLAEYFEVAAGERAAGNPHHDALKWNLRLGRAPRLARLESRHDLSEMTAADYRDAWAWVHFMLHGPSEAHDELVKYLGDIRANAAPGQLSARLESRLPGVEKRLVEHFRSWPR